MQTHLQQEALLPTGLCLHADLLTFPLVNVRRSTKSFTKRGRTIINWKTITSKKIVATPIITCLSEKLEKTRKVITVEETVVFETPSAEESVEGV